MSFAYPLQRFQDWFTQQWAIVWGKKINPSEVPWLMGPFGNLNGIGEEFIRQLAEEENLIINRNSRSNKLLTSIHELNLSENELAVLSEKVVAFYENTGKYKLAFTIKWNPFFKLFGILVNKLFSNRIHQLYIPTHHSSETEAIKSEIITLINPHTNEIKYTIWFRTFQATGQVIFSGVYGTCQLPSGKKCIKAVFPLPNGNATVILTPSIQENGALKLISAGEKFGDAGFYFVLKDIKNRYWAHYIKSFRDSLTVRYDNNRLSAEQSLTLWNQQVLTLTYQIEEGND